MNIEQKFDALALVGGLKEELLPGGKTLGRHLLDLWSPGADMNETNLSGLLYHMNSGPIGRVYYGDIDKGWFFCTQNLHAYGPLLWDDNVYRAGLTSDYTRVGFIDAHGVWHNTSPGLPSGSTPNWWNVSEGKARDVAVVVTPHLPTPPPIATLPDGDGLFHSAGQAGGGPFYGPVPGKPFGLFNKVNTLAECEEFYASNPSFVKPDDYPKV